MLLDIFIALLMLFLLILVVAACVLAYMTMPLSDLINAMLRRIGLAGPSAESRTVGVHGLGTVDEAFRVQDGEEAGVGKVFIKGETWNAACPAELAPNLVEGDTVEVIYNDDLTVTVVGKPAQAKKIHPATGSTRKPS